MEEITFGPVGVDLYAVSGCKIVSEIISVIIERERRQKQKQREQKPKLDEL